MKINETNFGILIFFIFLFSLAPLVYVADSSLFVAASFSLGSAHPPGYPLYILLGKLLTFIPIGNIAFRVNLVSAIFGTLTSLMVFKTSMKLTQNRHASWASAFICALSPLLFIESLKAEVYTLNSFLCMAVFYLGLRMLTEKHRAQFLNFSLLGFFLIGIGMGNHHTIGFMGMVFLLPVIINWREITPKWIIFSILSLLLGLSINALLYLRSVAYVKNGGLILYSYAGTLEQFLKVFSRQTFGGASTVEAIDGILSFNNTWLYGVKNSMFHIAFYNTKYILPFILLGLIVLRKNLTILSYFLFSFGIWFIILPKIVFGHPQPSIKDIQVVSPYFIPIIPVLYSLGSLGFARFIAFFEGKNWKILPRFIPFSIFILPFTLLPLSFNTSNLNNNFLAYDYGRDMLSTLPVKSLLLNYGDNSIFSAFYLRTVERLREDILVMNTAGKFDVYGLESSPTWKYAELYPDFYKKQKSTIKEMNRNFTLKGKLLASSADFTKIVSEHYSFYPYVISGSLYPKQQNDYAEKIKKDVRNKFKTDYEKINYERVLQLPNQKNFLITELQNIYSLTTMVQANFAKRAGDVKERDRLYIRAFAMSDSIEFIGPYIYFLLKENQEEEAFHLIDELKKIEGPYKEFAGVLEQRAVSIVGER